MTTYDLYSASYYIVILKQALNDIMGSDLDLDPVLDPLTQNVLYKYQLTQGISECDRFGAVFGPQTQEALNEHIFDHYVTDEALKQSARDLGVSDAAFASAVGVSSLYSNARTGSFKLKFDRRQFYRFICERICAQEAIALSHKEPDICSTLEGHFESSARELLKLKKAVEYFDFAYECGAYGIFKLKGEDWKKLGAFSAGDVYTTCKYNARKELNLLVNYIRSSEDLLNCLKNNDLAGYTRRYFNSSAVSNGLLEMVEQHYNSLLGI